ncbi:MAG: hypothetical protein J6T67_07885 [Paludibacteraceae bacterium]|nr:hypothetical protein [Paludibacteraceae bacterium]
MNPIFNKKERFYDYFTHLPMYRMKMDFQLGFFEQFTIRIEIQKVISAAYKRLVDAHDLVHVNVYPEIGEEFDEPFYRELKGATQKTFRQPRTWDFLQDFMPELGPDDDGALYLKLRAAVGLQLPKEEDGRVKLREALVLIINYDLDALSGQELLYLSKIQ